MIIYKKENHTAVITLNRPEKRNALNPELISELKKSLTEAETDSEVKILVITGNGKAFCAGADLAYLNELRNYSMVENEKDSKNIAELFLSVYNFPKPVIAAVNGAAVAGGCGLASVCDFIVADQSHAKFGYSEVRIGFLPAIVSVFLINRIGWSKAQNLMLSAEILDAQSALNIGLADYLSDDVMHYSLQLADKLAENSSESMRLTKGMFRTIAAMDVDDAVDYCLRLNAISRSGADFQKGLNKFLSGK
ncbi:MAG: enoyl-CoA hydratase-related protein [Ignavibacteriaceae bacterium]